MKKIFTLMAAALMGVGGMMAKPLTVEQLRDYTTELTPEGQQKIRADFAKLHMGILPDTETLTRSWQASNGTWQLIMVMNEQTLNEVLTFSDKDGKPVQLPFEECPFYYVDAILMFTPTNSQSATRTADLVLAWPSVYYCLQPADTPEDEIDWSAMTLTEFCNNDQLIRLFEQTGYIMNADSNGMLSSWAIISGPKCTYDGQEMYTDNGTTMQFYAYDSTDNYIEADANISLSNDSGRKGTMNCKYRGEADRVLGFEATTTTIDNFGPVVVYNGGLVSSALLGDDSPFTEVFDEMTALYVIAGGPGFTPGQVQGGGAFDRNKVGFAEVNIASNTQYNCIQGFMFVDPKYAQDTTLDPTEIRTKVTLMERVEDELYGEYDAIAPKIDSFLQGGYTYTWSVDYGTDIAKAGYYYFPSKDSNIAWGTTDGFVANMIDDYLQTFLIKSNVTEIEYHYDPTDITKARTFSAVGSLESYVNPDVVGVEAVKAEDNARIIARDGMINVVAGENAPIAIFTLDGKLVKATKASEVSVEAPKGMYVVRVGNKAKKVVL